MESRPVSFLTFFLLWARIQGWAVPLLHVRMCAWMEDCTDAERVLMVFRGAAKSTIYAVFKAWKLYRNRHHRSLVWSADNDTAGMLTADTINVLRNHPLTRGMLPAKPGAKRFWVTGARDARNASMRAVGVASNATGSRADDVDFDDVEVPGNIETPEARLKLRQRISESTHIQVPGGQKTYIGTPHTHDSIYPERIAGGAAVLKIPLFEHAVRFTDTAKRKRYPFPHATGDDGLYVMTGIGKGARMLVEGKDYRREGVEIVFPAPPGVVVDVCSMCAWPERFTRAVIAERRKQTLTLNAWDSQYMLEAKPLAEVRLDPERLRAYAVEPVLKRANGELGMWLGGVRIAGASCKWDPSSGKLKSDVSSFSIVLQDEQGRRYWHRALELRGQVAETDEKGEKIIGGQVLEIVKIVKTLALSRVVVETNGAGTFAPAYLKAAFKQARYRCGITEKHETANKNRRILDGIESPLNSGLLWAHTSVTDGPAYNQMRDWNPAVTEQPDDHLDSLAGALTETPERISRSMDWNPTGKPNEDWRPSGSVYEVELEG